MSTEQAETICDCPLCEFRDDRTAVYQHLQTSHKKSELSRKVLETEYADAEWVGQKYCKSVQAD